MGEKTGDYFYQKDGDYFFVSRKRDIIRRRSINMSPGAIEGELQKHPMLRSVIALATPSVLGEDEIKVVVIPVDGKKIHPKEIAEFAAENLPRHMRPRYIEVRDSVPVAPGTGRAQRAKLETDWATDATWDTEDGRFLDSVSADQTSRA